MEAEIVVSTPPSGSVPRRNLLSKNTDFSCEECFQIQFCHGAWNDRVTVVAGMEAWSPIIPPHITILIATLYTHFNSHFNPYRDFPTHSKHTNFSFLIKFIFV